MVEQEKIELLCRYVDGSLSADEHAKFEKLCIEDPSFAERVEKANYMQVLVDTGEDFEFEKIVY